jgi:hypothetical protein
MLWFMTGQDIVAKPRSSQQPQHLTKHNNMNSPLNNHNISPRPNKMSHSSQQSQHLAKHNNMSHSSPQAQHEPLISPSTTT